MKFLLSLCLLFTMCVSNAQETVKYNEDYRFCLNEFADIEILEKQGDDNTDLYQMNGELFTGCARADNPDNGRYFIYHFRAGIIQLQVGYYYNGNKSREFNFVNGKNHGRHIMYYEDGSLYIEEYYRFGLPVSMKRWHPNMQLAREALFEDGEMIYDRYYDESGEQVKKDKN